ISERRNAEARINNLAYYDQITHLPNRAFLEEQVIRSIASAQRNQCKSAVLFLDLDHFKNINDSLGHQSGDSVLVQVGERIKSRIRTSDTVGRYGGDEFIIVLNELRSPTDASDIARDLLKAITLPYHCNKTELRLTASIGISVYPDDASDYSQLVMNADAAMYHAKFNGRDNFQFFSAEMSKRAAAQLDMENRLRKAIELKQFVLYYQPQINLKTNEIIGVEALIRWIDPERGMIPPLEFIPLAEERGLIIPIGDWALEEACLQQTRWTKAGLPPLTMAVNVAASQFQHANLAEKVKDVIQKTQINPTLLEIEMTESAVMQDAEQLIVTLAALREIGVSLAVDDFGTGYSSLSYLKRFRLNKLKIDRSFVRDIQDDNEDLSIVKAIIALAHQMKISVIAEGVETSVQRDILKEANCDKYQGYYFSKPLPADEIETLLRKQLENTSIAHSA
ncbi:MAG TPA: EAL domain-containing protein, partial [Pseudomonadales bacterium]|nr:EAL domain-containing protein [Pseudomonadales bacterium]